MPRSFPPALAAALPFAVIGLGVAIGHVIVHGFHFRLETLGPVAAVSDNEATPAATPGPTDHKDHKDQVSTQPTTSPPLVPAAPLATWAQPASFFAAPGGRSVSPVDQNRSAPPTEAEQRARLQAVLALLEASRRQREAEAQGPRYRIASGVYQQRLAAGEAPRYLVVDGEGQGQLVIHLRGLAQLVIGASKVVINTTWQVDEANDVVTFTLTGGEPDSGYRALLRTALDRVTRFRIDEFQSDSLILRRVPDGEVFHWERINR